MIDFIFWFIKFAAMFIGLQILKIVLVIGWGFAQIAFEAVFLDKQPEEPKKPVGNTDWKYMPKQ